jgi:hypothetical protein
MGEEREARGLDNLNLTPSTAEPSLLIELIEPSFFFFFFVKATLTLLWPPYYFLMQAMVCNHQHQRLPLASIL